MAAPEQMRDMLALKSDIFSVGLMVWGLRTGCKHNGHVDAADLQDWAEVGLCTAYWLLLFMHAALHGASDMLVYQQCCLHLGSRHFLPQYRFPRPACCMQTCPARLAPDAHDLLRLGPWWSDLAIGCLELADLHRWSAADLLAFIETPAPGKDPVTKSCLFA